jgi:hypothetical protein
MPDDQSETEKNPGSNPFHPRTLASYDPWPSHKAIFASTCDLQESHSVFSRMSIHSAAPAAAMAQRYFWQWRRSRVWPNSWTDSFLRQGRSSEPGQKPNRKERTSERQVRQEKAGVS